jgi:hypothetical protein
MLLSSSHVTVEARFASFIVYAIHTSEPIVIKYNILYIVYYISVSAFVFLFMSGTKRHQMKQYTSRNFPDSRQWESVDFHRQAFSTLCLINSK